MIQRLGIIVCTFALFGGFIPLSAQRVTPPDQRAALLEDAMQLLEAEPQIFAEFTGGRENPFVAAPAQVERSETKPAMVPRSHVRLSDSRALTAVARSFTPSGSLIAGDRKLLRLVDGTTIREGEAFTARIQGERYRVTVAEIDPDGYTLALGDATVRRRFLGTGDSSSGSIVPFEPSPDAENLPEF